MQPPQSLHRQDDPDTPVVGLSTSGTLENSCSQLRTLALQALKRMYRVNERLFSFRLRKDHDQDILEGFSVRYTAMALIGLAEEQDDVVADILGGETPTQLCSRLLKLSAEERNLGDVALTLWAARALHHTDASLALERLKALDPCTSPHPTVELAWTLASLALHGDASPDRALADRVAQRLMASFREQSGVFPHWPDGAGSASMRSHIACFADLVYPTQALSFYGRAVEDPEAICVARRCADHMCETQGPQGQWWWHFDVRTGRVVEKFPVYSVHQDAMAPMALFAAQEACGVDYSAWIRRGLKWLFESPEIAGSLIDPHSGVIWRKVARHEPGKISRAFQAVACRAHPSLRVPFLGAVLRPGKIDFESRPYHMGWLLYAWSGDRKLRYSIELEGSNHGSKQADVACSPPV